MAEDTPELETLNLTRVKFTEALNAMKKMESMLPEFACDLRFDVMNLDKLELLKLAEDLDLEYFEYGGTIQVSYLTDRSQIVLMSAL